jgi:hypothetical protein
VEETKITEIVLVGSTKEVKENIEMAPREVGVKQDTHD